MMAEVTWGTFRPQNLIAARANVPHSPFFGFAYHPANSLNIRHMATESQDDISLFTWSRHDGRTFGDQSIQDKGANLHIDTTFLNHPDQQQACVLRITAKALDISKAVEPTSLVFYAVATEEEHDLQNDADMGEDDKHQWGTIQLENAPNLSDEGIDDDIRIAGNAKSIGGKYTILVKQPTKGILNPSTFSITEEPHRSTEATGSRSLIRSRSEKPQDTFGYLSNFHVSTSTKNAQAAWAIEKSIPKALKRRQHSSKQRQPFYVLDDSTRDDSPVVFVQRILQVPFEMEATFVLRENRDWNTIKGIEKDITGSGLNSILERSRQAFDDKFERVFQLKAKGVSEEEQVFASAALANILGGIGFFYGSSVVNNDRLQGRIDALRPVRLFTATPSRALFPRGFLWDEGFHQLIIQRWDAQLSLECLLSWIEVGQEDGWIPREQILGIEARNRFPSHIEHLIIQDPSIANPPTILLAIHALLQLKEFCDKENRGLGSHTSECEGIRDMDVFDQFRKVTLRRASRYYSWLKSSQSGHLPNSFRWRGRSQDKKSKEGYVLTLASGLDDFPRAVEPTQTETHVDLHSWVTWASGTLGRIYRSFGDDRTASEYEAECENLKESLIERHGKRGLDEDGTEYLMCDHDGDDKVCHIGYPTILPLLLGLLDPADRRVKTILDTLEDGSLLRARAGVRSLSKSDIWYRGGDDYWTGSVWMPFNYLVLAALKTKYSVLNGPYRAQAANLYSDLRRSILNNTFRVFKQTGLLWENYSPEDGAGKSGRQFTGWSSLIVLIYAEMYHSVV
ncbi:alpha-glucosidase [Gracilaria domingensis]|nr:alpha-glucosidase [Gracilaria domingensis]